MRFLLLLAILFFSSILGAPVAIDIKQWEAKLIGKKYVTSGSVSAKNVIRSSDLPPNTRVLKPDSSFTLDYIPDRLNVRINQKSIISGVFLG